MRMHKSLVELDRRRGPTATPTMIIRTGWLLDVRNRQLVGMKEAITVPDKLSKRGNTAKNNPNSFYDTSAYVRLSDGPFWAHCLELATKAKDQHVKQLIASYMENPIVFGKEVAPEDWVILTTGDEPIAMRPRLFAEYERRRQATLQQGEIGFDVVMGEQGPIARLHPALKFGPNGGSPASLISVNEGAMQWNGEKQAFNCPMTVANAEAYPRALNHQFRESAFFTDTCVIALWPNEGVEHGIIPIFKDIATKYFKLKDGAEVDALWQRLVELEDLDTEIHMAALVQKMSRVSIRGYRALPAGVIRARLLAFRECFSGIDIPKTFRWVLPYTTERGKPTISGTCFLDTAWAILMGQDYSPHLKTVVDARLRAQGREADWSCRDRFLQLYLRWSAILNPRKASQQMDNQEGLSERALKMIKSTLFDEELTARVLESHSGLQPEWQNHPAYKWGRFLAVCCAIKVYYHYIQHAGKRLPRPQDDALKRGMSNPFAFIASYRPERYLEQIEKIRRGGILLAMYQCLFDDLGSPPPAVRFSQREKSLVVHGFCAQMQGLERARKLKWESSTIDALDDEAETPLSDLN